MNYMDELLKCVDEVVGCEESVARFQSTPNAHRADMAAKMLRGSVSKIKELITTIENEKKFLASKLSESVQKDLLK